MADLWDVKKFPGPRALRKSPKTTLEFALIADGVPAKDVYKVLGTKDGVDRAFKKLEQLRPNVKVWWTAGAQPPQLLADGEVVMTTAWNGRIYDAVKNSGKNFKIVWDGQGLDFNLWAIPKGTKNLALAQQFVAFTVKPEVMAHAVAVHLLRPDAEGRDEQGAGGHPGRPAERAGEREERLRRLAAVLGRPRGGADRALQQVARALTRRRATGTLR